MIILLKSCILTRYFVGEMLPQRESPYSIAGYRTSVSQSFVEIAVIGEHSCSGVGQGDSHGTGQRSDIQNKSI